MADKENFDDFRDALIFIPMSALLILLAVLFQSRAPHSVLSTPSEWPWEPLPCASTYSEWQQAMWQDCDCLAELVTEYSKTCQSRLPAEPAREPREYSDDDNVGFFEDADMVRFVHEIYTPSMWDKVKKWGATEDTRRRLVKYLDTFPNQHQRYRVFKMESARIRFHNGHAIKQFSIFGFPMCYCSFFDE